MRTVEPIKSISNEFLFTYYFCKLLLQYLLYMYCIIFKILINYTHTQFNDILLVLYYTNVPVVFNI